MSKLELREYLMKIRSKKVNGYLLDAIIICTLQQIKTDTKAI